MVQATMVPEKVVFEFIHVITKSLL